MAKIDLKKISNKRVYVSNSDKRGRGLFAVRKIKKNELIGFFRGKLVKFYVKNKADSLKGEYWLYIKKNTWLDVKSIEKYINHSCEPNAGVTGAVTIRAMKDINKDEEITLDYSTLEEDPDWYMECQCGLNNCRKRIRSIQFLPKKMYNKYANFIPTYLKKKYDTSKIKNRP